MQRLAADQAAGIVEAAAAVERDALGGADGSVVVGNHVGAERHRIAFQSLLGALCRAVGDRSGADVQCLVAAQQAAGVVELAVAERGVDIAAGLNTGAAIVDRAAVQVDVSQGRNRAAIGQLPIRIDDHIAGAGANLPGIAHAESGFGADQGDFAGIHATELGDIDGHGRCRTRAGNRRRLAVVGADLIGAGRDLDLFGPESGIDLYRAGNQVGVVALRGIKAAALDDDLAALDPETVKIAVVDDRRAGGQRRAGCIDEAAAVAGDASGVGDDDLGTITADFDITAQQAGCVGVDLVENDAGGAAGQVGVALDPAAKLGLGIGAGVVEDGAVLLHIELAVGVARYACGAGRLDVDQGNTVRCAADCRLLVLWGVAVTDNLRLSRVDRAKGAAQGHQHGQGTRCETETLRRRMALAAKGSIRAGIAPAVAAGAFGRGDQHAACFIEDDPE